MKRLLALLLCVTVAILCVPTVYAHPGGTDENGGHWAHSTGEYHYHHGYPAHDHYDMDGDGIIDCPYDFDDKSGENSGSNSNNSDTVTNRSHTSSSVTQTVPIQRAPVQQNEEEQTVPSWVYWVFGGQALLSLVLLILNKCKKATIERMTYEHKNDIDILKKSCDEKIAAKNASDSELEQTCRYIIGAKQELDDVLSKITIENRKLSNIKEMRCKLKKAPLDVSFSKNGLPVYWKPSMDKPYGDYTVFVSYNSGIYHVDRFCAGYRGREDHIFNVINKARPCRKCAAGFFDFDSVPDWYSGDSDDVVSEPHEDQLLINWRD